MFSLAPQVLEFRIFCGTPLIMFLLTQLYTIVNVLERPLVENFLQQQWHIDYMLTSSIRDIDHLIYLNILLWCFMHIQMI